MLGVFTPNRLFRSMRLVNADAKGRDHELLIPLDDTPTLLFVVGRGVQVFEQGGGLVPPEGKRIYIPPRMGNAPNVINFLVRDAARRNQ